MPQQEEPGELLGDGDVGRQLEGARERQVDRAVPPAQRVGHVEADHSQEGHPQHRVERPGEEAQLGEGLPAEIHPDHEEDGGEGAGHPQPGVGEHLPVALEGVLGRRVERLVAGDGPGDEGGDDRGGDDGAEDLQGKIAQDDLHGEQRPADGDVVGGGETRRGAAPHQDLDPVGRHLQPLAQPGGDHGAQPDHRALAAERAAGADGDDRREGVDQHRPWRDPSTRQGDGLDQHRHPLALPLPRGVAVGAPVDDPQDHSAGRRRGHHHPAVDLGDEGEQVAGGAPEEGLDGPDQEIGGGTQQAAHDADGGDQEEEDAVFPVGEAEAPGQGEVERPGPVAQAAEPAEGARLHEGGLYQGRPEHLRQIQTRGTAVP